MDAEVNTAKLIADTAGEILAKARGDLSAATDKMEARVRQDDFLFRSLMSPLVRQACYDALRSQVRKDRAKIWTAPNYTQGGNGQRLEALATTLLDFRLPHASIALRDAKREDVEAAAQWYESSASNMAHKARWLRAVAEKIGKAKVGNKLTAEQLADLQEATK